jgi:DNA-binding IclR family transcriptional regulator
VLNKDIVESTGMWKGTVHKRLERLAYLKLVKHREGKSALTTLGRAVLDKAGIKREEEA